MTGPLETTLPGDDSPGLALRRRRFAFAVLVLASSVALLGLMAATLFPAGPDPVGIAMLVMFGLTLPWTTTGFWNAVIGFALMTFAREPAALVAPPLRCITGDEKIASPTALLVCIRNEGTARLSRNLHWMLEGLVATGESRWFHLYLLSDSNQPAVFAAEEKLAAELSDRFGTALTVTYRRREHSVGFKAGNVRDFCERWGHLHQYAIVLDADSVMTPKSMLRVVRIMQAQPTLGILQTLVTGLPSASGFARIFQFGMRLGMRSYTLGAAFWQGDCGPYWGHNAILRLAPFIAHCHLPVLPGKPPLGGHVLSHDQLEAVLMRRAGFEVRVLPDEEGSWEENPPTLPEFIRRDLRWCQGNMQYFHFLALPGLRPVSRCQVALAIGMYVGSPAWLAFVLLGLARDAPMRADLGLFLFITTMVMSFAPKLATLADVLLRRALRQAYG
ncbi:MAG: glucans biosynthesis glucosyltransferase MdoH, partial [Burkholderiales bacterium]